MYPKLFNADATSWASFGIGVLSGAISCDVEENRNGSYELEMTYPVTAPFYDELKLRRLIVAKPNYTDDPQPFRIYDISKPLNGVVTVKAQHISYDLSGFIDAPFEETGITAALQRMVNSNTVYPTSCPFTFSTDLTGSQVMKVKHPQSVRALMGGVEGSLIDLYGGEWHFNGYACELKAHRGEDRGVLIRYGKNLTDLRQEENNAAVYTGVYPYYYNADTEILVTLTEKVVSCPGTFGYTKILPLDLTGEFEEAPTETALRSKANSYIESNQIGVPKINLTISFVESDSFQDRVDLCDTVSVRFDALGVSASAKCIRTKWDVLKGRYIEAELGSARNSLAATIAKTTEIAKAIDERSSQFQAIAKSVASKVTGNSGGYIVLHDTDNDGNPDEILILDNEDITQAVNVIRMNNGGIAFSQNGYTGTYTTAWNINGQFVADFIASGELSTQSVKILGDTNFYWDSNYITMVDPSDSNKMIRFGRYDGSHYGLGFTVDGGQNWLSSLSFDGMALIDPSSNWYVNIKNQEFFIKNANNVYILDIGRSVCLDEDFEETTGEFYQIGTVSGTVRYDSSINYPYDETHGLYSVSLGTQNLPRGYRSIAIGKGNEALEYHSICLGADNNGYGLRGITIGLRNTADFVPHEDPVANPHGYMSGIAIGSDNYAKGSLAMAFGYNNHTEYAYSACIGLGLIGGKYCQFVVGQYNKEDANALFIVGGGYTSIISGERVITRKNALVYKTNGSLCIEGQVISSSDARYKTICGVVPDVSNIHAVRYKWNERKLNHDDIDHIGYIAQDVEPVAPYLVQEDDEGYKSLDYTGLLCAKVEMLEQTVSRLMAKIDELEARLNAGA